jgi:hypothetical protein
MASDLARISFDPGRQYRAVIAQQGRVTLEADVNEASAVASEALRLGTFNIIGPVGTPDDGYKVMPGPNPGEIEVRSGVMYLGGWRLTLDHNVNIAAQPDWLDQPVSHPTGHVVVSLLVTEQSVSAVEDYALREVALGGPDTAARTRLMQHFLQLPGGPSCDDGAEAVQQALASDGVTLDAKNFNLVSSARLQVGFVAPAAANDPCTPAAQGGYLGADNQLVRVTVIDFDPTDRKGTLLWGWNNASFLYRASVRDLRTLTLTPVVPVDPEHAPQLGQVVEVLRSRAALGYPKDDGNFVAADAGFATAVHQAYSFDIGTFGLADALPGEYLTDPHPLFVRLWQAKVSFTAGEPAALDATSGLTVTITMTAALPSQIAARPFWRFAVRPSTPGQVYPQRYKEARQPPEGPRQWLCPLAVLSVTRGDGGLQVQLAADCRAHFLPLTKVQPCECCSLVLDPAGDWLAELTAALESKVKAVSVCFQPGRFNVPKTIKVSGKSVKMTGAGFATKLIGTTLEVVLEFDQCTEVALSDLAVHARVAGYLPPLENNLQGAVTIRRSNEVDIERVSLSCADADLRSASCLAVYNLPPDTNAASRQYNVRVLNSRFNVGHCQVGILLVNADRAQVEGNLVVTSLQSLGITMESIGRRPLVASRLRKQLLHSMTIIDTAPPTTARAKARARKRARRAAAARAAPAAAAPAAGAPASEAAPAAEASAHETAPAAAPPAATPPASAEPAATPAATARGHAAFVPPRVDLGVAGRAHVTATFGTIRLRFISSDKLSNAWTDALSASGLTAASTKGQVHKAVKAIATDVLKSPATAAPAFRNFLAATLPQLYSTSGQGIVVAGNLANDVRILNNTVDGTAQGIHIGFSDGKLSRPPPLLMGKHVQIRGNTVNVRLTAEMTGDRHGIFVRNVKSAIINDNHIELTSHANAGQDVYAIKIAGHFGPQLLVERNCMLNFTAGIVTATYEPPARPPHLWKTSDNVSTLANRIDWWINQVDNMPP